MPKNLSHPGQYGSADRFQAVVPDDGADLPLGVARALFVGAGGAVALRGPAGDQIVLQSGDSQYHPLLVSRVLAAGTTATDIVALY